MSDRQRTIGRQIAWGTMLIGALLLFTSLGRYALWDDEAGTALTAKSILRNGDALAFVDDHNILAYRQGIELQGDKLRYVPPLSSYLTAAVFAMAGEKNALVARLPFAIFGLATLAWLLGWTLRYNAPPLETALVGVGMVTNATFLLYSRQCRYYAIAIFLSAILATLYLTWDGSRRRTLWLLVLSILLFATNYLSHFALYACLAVDYVFFRRRSFTFRWKSWALLLAPQLLACAIIASIWNPFIQDPRIPPQNSFAEKVTLFFRQWPQLNNYEMLCGGVILAAVGVALIKKDRWLFRGVLAVVVYVIAVSALSPQRVAQTSDAAMRYLVPIIPLGVFLAARTILLVTRGKILWATVAATLVFGTNLMHGGPFLWCGFRSTILAYVTELVRPLPEPYTPVAAWINENTKVGATIWAVPDYTPYPLMFHAPHAVYAWQLPYPPPPALKNLPSIHFNGVEPPEFIIVFGPYVPDVQRKVRAWRDYGILYELDTTLDYYWVDLFRPELRWRSFEPKTNYDRATEAVYILKLRRT